MSSKLAIEGGAKAVKQMGSYPTRIHVDELLEVLDLWEFPAATRKTLETIIRKSAKEIKKEIVEKYGFLYQTFEGFEADLKNDIAKFRSTAQNLGRITGDGKGLVHDLRFVVTDGAA